MKTIFKLLLSATICLLSVSTTYSKQQTFNKFTCEINPSIEQRISIQQEPSLIDDILKEAEKHIGKKYVWATRGPKTFDCSGFVYYVYKQFDMSLSPSSRNQYTIGEHVDVDEAKPGDLIFFHSKSHPRDVGHVGIVHSIDGDRIMFIHASCKKGITISELEGYYKRNFVGLKRVLE